jgi:hypothetical protein
LWDLPLLRSVQFPFRLLPLTEFALATAISQVAWRPAALGAAVAPLVAISGFIMAAAPADQGVSIADVEVRHVDVPENLPPGPRSYSWPSRWAIGVASAHRQSLFAGGVTTDPVFYFPSWQVRCGGRLATTFPASQTQLLAYHGRNCSRELAWTTPEKVGAGVTLLGLLLLFLGCSIRSMRPGLWRQG